MGVVGRLSQTCKESLSHTKALLLWCVGKRHMHRVVGTSMEPSLFEGDLVLTLPTHASEIDIDDIVIALHGRSRWIKRISSKVEDSFTLESDNPYDAVDSRHVGSFSNHDLDGKAIAVFTRKGRFRFF